MDDTEQEQFHDDHVEITDLPEETEAAGRFRTLQGGRARQSSPSCRLSFVPFWGSFGWESSGLPLLGGLSAISR
jgi:hypothetical protein